MRCATLLYLAAAWLARLSVFSLAFAGCLSSIRAAEVNDRENQTILVLGDSLAAGYGLDPDQSYPALLQKKIKEAGWSFTVVNAGLSGDTTAGGLRRMEWLLKRRVDVLLLALGGNDGLRGTSVKAMQTNLQAIIDRTKQKYPGVKIVVVGMKMPPNMGDYAKEFNEVFPEVAKENKAALVPFLLEGVGGKPELNLPDLIHPTAEGQKLLAANVWKVLGPALDKVVVGQKGAWNVER